MDRPPLVDDVLRSQLSFSAVEASEGWVTSVRASSPPLTLLGSLDGVEAGLRQLRRTRPLEMEMRDLPGGRSVTVPTLEEMLRVKAYLVVQRNATRDYIDTAALAECAGQSEAIAILARVDDYYVDRSREDYSVLTALVQRLAAPAPRDSRVTRQLPACKGLAERWHDWRSVVTVCHALADGLLTTVEERER